MVAKTPDYIIADCGCPQWNTSGREIADDFDIIKNFAISIDKNKKLLPQRETITDYYVQVLANKLNAWEAAAAAKQRETLYQINKRYDDPSIVKCMKTQRNEATKRSISQQQQEQELQQQQQHSNYTRTSSR